jgi:hypothetical protein
MDHNADDCSSQSPAASGPATSLRRSFGLIRLPLAIFLVFWLLVLEVKFSAEGSSTLGLAYRATFMGGTLIGFSLGILSLHRWPRIALVALLIGGGFNSLAYTRLEYQFADGTLCWHAPPFGLNTQGCATKGDSEVVLLERTACTRSEYWMKLDSRGSPFCFSEMPTMPADR